MSFARLPCVWCTCFSVALLTYVVVYASVSCPLLWVCVRVCVRVCVCVCVLTGLLFSMLHAPPSNTTFLLACVNVWCLCLRGANDEGAGKE